MIARTNRPTRKKRYGSLFCCKTYKTGLNLGGIENLIGLFQKKRPKCALLRNVRHCPDVFGSPWNSS